MAGRFVVLEGVDGSGKSTQAGLLAARLRALGRPVTETFEPGATPLGSGIRALLLDGEAPVDPRAEALLMAADRAQHTSAVIRPALAQGNWVVCDRFVPSSLVYQGLGRELGVDAVAAWSAAATEGLEPDVVVVVAVPEAVAAARRGVATDRLEREDGAFHARVQAGYRELAASHGWRVVDGTGSVEEVAARVWAEVESPDA